MMIRRRFVTNFLVLVLLFGGAFYTYREARAVLALLVEPALNWAAGLVLQSIGRQAVLTVGVAANDASWVVPLTSLASRAVGILRIAGANYTYELPTLPDTPIPAPPSALVPSGTLGTYGNPFPYNSLGLGVVLVNNSCSVSGANSSDGFVHNIPLTYPSFASAAAACAANMVWHKYGTGAISIVYQEPNDPEPLDFILSGQTVYAQSIRVLISFSNGIASILETHYGLSYAASSDEQLDQVKRFIRTAGGFRPDPSDPDWTAAEKAAFQTPSSVQFKAASSVVTVAATATSTLIQAATQSGADVRYRDTTLSEVAVPTAVSEQLIKNSTAEQVAAAQQSGTSGQTIVFPSDYARQGEAVAAATLIDSRLDLLHEDLTKQTTATADPVAPDSGGFGGVFFKDTFVNLLSWSLPPHTSICPVAAINFNYFGRLFNLNLDAQCTLLMADSVRPVAAESFTVMWLLAAMFIVLGA